MLRAEITEQRKINGKNYQFAIYVCTQCMLKEEKRADTVHEDTLCKKCKKANKLSIKYPKLYNLWTGMKGRCYTKSGSRWVTHGGRGIIVCEEWKNSSNIFMQWALDNGYREPPKGVRNTRYTLDRIDNDGNYEPRNCRIVDTKVQGFNRQVLQRNNTTGYRGVSFSKSHGKFCAIISTKSEGRLFCEYFDSSLVAAIVREHYIDEHNLPHITNFSAEEWDILKELPVW